MLHSFKMVLNTAASYARIAVHAVVGVVVTRVALQALGVDDYGLFNLVAGVVAMLSFVDGALSVSAQRYYSIALGRGDEDELARCFTTSMAIHVVIAAVLLVVLFALMPLLFGGFLNINPSQRTSAEAVYAMMLGASAVTVAAIPYAAMMNAYEDIFALSVINIVSYAVQLAAALLLLVAKGDLLLLFAAGTAFSVVVKVVLSYVWCRRHYGYAAVVRRHRYDRGICRQMAGLAGWNTLGSGAVLLRNQGVAIVLNIFFGVAVNAAYGIANQVNALVLSFATSLTVVFTPMIIQAHGAGDEKRMLSAATLSSKMSTLLSMLMALPLLALLRPILRLWLGTVPEHTEAFCLLVVLAFLIQEMCAGQNRVVYAVGRIRAFQLWQTILCVGILPLGALLFWLGCDANAVLCLLTLSQVAILWVTFHYVCRYTSWRPKAFLWSLAKSVFLFAFVLLFLVYLLRGLALWASLPLVAFATIMYAAAMLRLSFNAAERSHLTNLALALASRAGINLHRPCSK